MVEKKVKHFTKTDDFAKEDYLEIFRRAKIFQDGLEQGKNFTDVCPGKVIASMFFQESARTSSLFQMAMIRLGGGWIGISGTAGTYVDSGEENMRDFLNGYAVFSDIMAVRHKSLDLSKMAVGFPIPLMNGMCGGDEHSIGGISWIYALSKRFGDLSKIKVGVYGMTKSSRPTKALIKALSIFGGEIHEDPVIEEFRTPAHIQEFVKKIGGNLIPDKYDDFLSKMDFVLVAEGLPQKGEDEKLVERYNEEFKILTQKEVDRLKPGALIEYGEPRMMTDGRLIAEEAIDNDPRVMNKVFMKEFIYVTMALITYLLDIEVK
jgi:aspartate carbamoyltransferase catalytic subunit